DEHQCAAVAAQMLDAVDRSVKIRADNIAGVAAIARMDAGLGGAFDQPIGGAGFRQILLQAHLAMHEAHATLRRPGHRHLAARALQISQGGDLPIGMSRLEPQRRRCADEPCSSGHYDADWQGLLEGLSLRRTAKPASHFRADTKARGVKLAGWSCSG